MRTTGAAVGKGGGNDIVQEGVLVFRLPLGDLRLVGHIETRKINIDVIGTKHKVFIY